MNNSIVNVPEPVNEPIKDYKPNSTEKDSVLATYKHLKNSTTDVKMWIGGKFVESSKTSNMSQNPKNCGHPGHGTSFIFRFLFLRPLLDY